MKKFLTLLFFSFFLFLVSPVHAQSVELLPQPNGWHLTRTTSGDVQLYQTITNLNILNGKSSMTLTYDLHGTCLRTASVDPSGEDSGLIFNQSVWRVADLSTIGVNCFNGPQTVTFPLTLFRNLITTNPLPAGNDQFHIRIWQPQGFTVDVTSAKLNPVPTPTPTPSPTPTPTPIPTPTPSPSPSADWAIQSVDMMKYSKDVVCNQPSQATVDTMVQRAKDSGANYIAISTQYDNTATGYCGNGVTGNALALTTKWVNSIRAHGLHVWFRQMSNSFEGINGVTKVSNTPAYTNFIVNYILANPTLYQPGDIFTPTPEPDSAGISGVTYCPTICQFTNATDFNNWIQNTQVAVKNAFTQIGVSNVQVGYYGTSGFIVYGANNSDWYGKSFLTAATVASMNNVIAMDDYPESFGQNLSYSMTGFHKVWPNATLVMGEWGTIDATNSAQAVQQVNTSMAAAKQPFVTGFNYWNLGPAGHESLLNSDLSTNATYTAVQNFFKALQ